MLVVKNEQPSDEGEPTARSHGPTQTATQALSSSPKHGSQVSPMSALQVLGSHLSPVAEHISRVLVSAQRVTPGTQMICGSSLPVSVDSSVVLSSSGEVESTDGGGDSQALVDSKHASKNDASKRRW